MHCLFESSTVWNCELDKPVLWPAENHCDNAKQDTLHTAPHVVIASYSVLDFDKFFTMCVNALLQREKTDGKQERLYF